LLHAEEQAPVDLTFKT